MIIITGSARVAPENRAAALKLGIEHSARSRAEPGCIAHNCHTDAEDPGRIVFLELWEDLAAVRQHFSVPESGNFVRDLRAISDGVPEIALYESTVLPAPKF